MAPNSSSLGRTALLTACLLCPDPARAPSASPSPCGAPAVVALGDTLSRIAERCDVSEALLLGANPGISGSEDLRAGLQLRLRRDDPDLGARFDRAVGSVVTLASRAGTALNDLASEVGAPVDDLLTKNPDLHNRLRQLGDRLGIAGADAGAATAFSPPASGPPGTLVTVSALGLPANTPVVVGTGGRRSAYEVLDRARTSGDGTLLAAVPVPAWAGDAGQLVFVVASPERGLAVRSARSRLRARLDPDDSSRRTHTMSLITSSTASARFGRSLLGLLLVLAPLWATIAAETGDLDQLRSRALALVNQDRTERGLNRLQPGEDLNEAAQAHASDMLQRSYFAHASLEGDIVQDRYIEAGGSRWRLVAENIARCMGCEVPPTPARVEQLHQGWMDSPGHRENILRRGLDRFGFGIVVGDDQALYAVQTFAGPGLPHGLAGGEDPVPLPPEQRSASALQVINRARGRAGVPPLQANPALDQVARALLPPAGRSADLVPTGDLLGAIPSEQRSRWQRVAVVLGACGGCGTEPAMADLRFFRDQWLDSAQNRATLLDPSATHLGFAITANGEGAKTTMAMVGITR